MQTDTKHRLLNTSETLFAERGFCGVSIADCKRDGVLKQACFTTTPPKKSCTVRYYKESLMTSSSNSLKPSKPRTTHWNGSKRFTWDWQSPHRKTCNARACSCESLDKNGRANSAENWYLKGFLTRIIQMVKAVEGLSELRDEQALITAYQWLGAVNYFLISADAFGYLARLRSSKCTGISIPTLA